MATLRVLRFNAYMMMLDREDIKQELRDTAYLYAPKEAVTAVSG